MDNIRLRAMCSGSDVLELPFSFELYVGLGEKVESVCVWRGLMVVVVVAVVAVKTSNNQMSL